MMDTIPRAFAEVDSTGMLEIDVGAWRTGDLWIGWRHLVDIERLYEGGPMILPNGIATFEPAACRF